MDFAAIARQLLQLLESRIEWLRAEIDPQWANALGQFAFRPTEAELELVLTECFFASMLTEEQRPTRFVISLLPEPQPSGDASSGFIRFEQPQPLTRSALRSLAPAAPPDSSLLCVQRGAPGELRITGIHSFARHYGRPTALSFATTGAGSITVSFNNVRLMSIVHGEVSVVGDGMPFDERTLSGVLAMHQRRNDGEVAHNAIVCRVLLRSVGMIRREAHGGAIWLLPPRAEFEGTARIVASTGTLFDVVRAIEERSQRHARTPELMAGVREGAAENLLRDVEEEAMAKAIAHLTATDGAVLMTMEPKLIGYSSFTHASPPTTITDVRDGRQEERASTDLGGGRHRSAAAFCAGGQPGERAAIVVSQDGGVSLFMSIAGPIPPLLWHLPNGVARIRLASVGRGFAFA